MNPITEAEIMPTGITKLDVLKICDTSKFGLGNFTEEEISNVSSTYQASVGNRDIDFVAGLKMMNYMPISMLTGEFILTAIGATLITLAALKIGCVAKPAFYTLGIGSLLSAPFVGPAFLHSLKKPIWKDTIREFQELHNRMKHYSDDTAISEADTEYLFRYLERTRCNIKDVSFGKMHIKIKNCDLFDVVEDVDTLCQKFLKEFDNLITLSENSEEQYRAMYKSLENKMRIVPLTETRPVASLPVIEPEQIPYG